MVMDLISSSYQRLGTVVARSLWAGKSMLVANCGKFKFMAVMQTVASRVWEQQQLQ